MTTSAITQNKCYKLHQVGMLHREGEVDASEDGKIYKSYSTDAVVIQLVVLAV